jgi:hypothetical protein
MSAPSPQEQALEYRATTVKPPYGRAKITNKPLSKWDGNTAIGRRVRDLFRAIAKAAGDPVDVVSQTNILAIAETIAAIETQRAKAVKGEDVDLAVLTRMQNAVSREIKRLGIRSAPPLMRIF